KNRRRRSQAPATRPATERSVACVPRPRSWACEHRERSPCELDTTALRRSPSGTLEIATPIAPCLAELDHCRNGLTLSPGVFCRSRRRASEAGITSYGPSVVHVSRQHLVHQHVGRLNADPNHTRQQAHHGVWSIIGRLLKMVQARLLDLPNLIADKPSALHVAPQLSQRVRPERLALRRSQTVKAAGGPFQFWVESADAHPEPRHPQSVVTPTVRAAEALGVGAFGILLMWEPRPLCMDCARGAQPAEKSSLEQLGVETVGLRSPMLARHRHTRGVNDVGLNAARLEPACQPEAVTAGLEGNDNAFDPASCFLRFLPPSMQQPQ